MGITVAQTEKLLRLAKGDTLPSSILKGELFEWMVSDGILVAVTRGSRKSYRARDGRSLRDYIAAHFDIRDLEKYCKLLQEGGASRAEQVRMTGNSKTIARRTFCGFMVNCYEPIPVMLAGKSFNLLPEEGTFAFIYDFNTFSIPGDTVVVGIENAENFRYIREQRPLFESISPKESRLLFVSRYPQEQSRDLMQWLISIPNRYVHFGDLDLAGIHIYQSEYYGRLGERSSFLIPQDYEYRISTGSSERYDNQYSRFGKMKITDSRVASLVECIHRYHKGYDQEGFIGS